ncbi:MAG: pantetheine-phosphate adenylyltransferase [Candidatus Makaraimicrobium thalassicum]|nr:MAG: pantetheine-phosphate adenylyltransferase [Candidatus Omnitrophota bacterium]
MTRRAVYPGTFDPVTYGHLDVIKRVAVLFDRVFVAVAHSGDKSPLFSVEERVAMMAEAAAGFDNVEVGDFNGLVVDYAAGRSARVVVRGLRMISDFEYEFQMALTNRKLNPEIETVFMMPNEAYSYLSSKLIKEAARLGADVSKFVPENVEKKLKEKLVK